MLRGVLGVSESQHQGQEVVLLEKPFTQQVRGWGRRGAGLPAGKQLIMEMAGSGVARGGKGQEESSRGHGWSWGPSWRRPVSVDLQSDVETGGRSQAR